MKHLTVSKVMRLALVAVTAIGVEACTGSTKSGRGNSPTTASGRGDSTARVLKLGFLGPLTGVTAQLGIGIEDGEKLALAQYNSSRPSLTVTIDAFDSQGQPAQAENGAANLSGENVVAVIGPALPGESAAADPIFEQLGIPNISASVTTPAQAQHAYKYFHRVLADDSRQGPADADYFVRTLGEKSIAVVDDDSTYGAGLTAAFTGQVLKDGGEVAVTDHLDPNGQDYGSTVNRVVASPATAVFFGGYYYAAGRFIHELKAAGFTGAFMSGDGSENASFVADAGGASFADGAWLSCACADETTNPAARSFVRGYQEMFGAPPATYSAEAYDATNFVLAAIKSGATTRTAINNYLTTKSYAGLTKTIKFLPDGNVSGGTIYVYEVDKGRIVQTTTTS